MKTTLLRIVVGLAMLAPVASWAGVEKFDSDEFNAIISDNLKAEKDLRTQLKENTGLPDFDKEAHREFTKEVVGVGEEENIASPTTEHPVHHKDRAEGKLFEKNLKRVSQELDSSESE